MTIRSSLQTEQGHAVPSVDARGRAAPGQSTPGLTRPRKLLRGVRAILPTTVPAILLALVLTATAGVIAPDSAHAQVRSLTWTEAMSFEIPGALGTLMGAMPGSPVGDSESRHALHVEGPVLIQEDGESSSYVIDAERGEILSIDHEARTVLRFTFAEAGQMAVDMQEMMQEMAEDEELQEARRQQEEAMEEMRQAREDSELAMDFSVSTESTGETRDFGEGISADRHFVIAEVEVTEEVEGAETPSEGAVMLILVELWQSDDVPEAEQMYEEWSRNLADNPDVQALADQMAASLDESGQESGAQALSMWDPRVSAGMIEVAEAVDELEGTTIRSVTTVALVPMGMEVPREDLLAWEPESMGSRLAGSAGNAVRDAARNAFGGIFGGGDDDEEEEEVGVQPLLRMTSVRSDLLYSESGTSVATPLYETIQGYDEMTLQELMERARAGADGG